MIDPGTGDTILLIMGVVAAAILTGVPTWLHHQDCLSYIQGDLGRYHPRDLKIRNDWMSYGRYSFTYDVEYRDTDGRMHYNRCTVSWDDEVASTVTWDTPLDQKASEPWPRLSRKQFD